MGAPRGIAVLAIGLAAGCGPSPAGPGADLHLEVISGDAQAGVAGQPLPDGLVLRVMDGRGRPVPGVGVEMRVVSGSGVVFGAGSTSGSISGPTGYVRFRWTLGADPSALNISQASVPGAAGASVELSARAISPEEADVVRLTGLGPGPTFIVPISADPEPRILRVDDSVFITVLSRRHTEHVVFSRHRPPTVFQTPAEASPATVRVDLPEPVPVPFRFIVRAPPFDSTVRILEDQLRRVEDVFGPFGAVPGPAEFVDRTENGPEYYPPWTSCLDGPPIRPGDPVEVFVARFQAGYGGLACGATGHIALSTTAYFSTPILAHELGHLLDLDHYSAAGGVMLTGEYKGDRLEAWQAFHAFADEFSILNAMGLAPAGMVRRCRAVAAGSASCLPEGFVLPAEWRDP